MNPIQAKARLRTLQRWVGLTMVALLVIELVAAGWALTWFAFVLCATSALVVWLGWQSIRHLAHHVRLRLRGHVAIARIVAYRQDPTCDEPAYQALVSFVTSTGESRPLTPLTAQYEDPPQNSPDEAARRARGLPISITPSVGHTLRVVYDPRDPTWADELASWLQVTLLAICCLIAILLFGTMLIATLATGFGHQAVVTAAA